MEYVKGTTKLHVILTECLMMLQQDADADGVGNRSADEVLMVNIGNLTLQQARVFRSNLISLGYLSVDGDTYMVDLVAEVVPKETIAMQWSARSKKRVTNHKRRPASVTSAKGASPQPVTEAELSRAHHALLARASADGISPQTPPPGGRKSACSTIELMLGVSNRRATTLLIGLIRNGLVERVPKSSKVRVLERHAPAAVAEPPTHRPSLTSVTYEELKAAILKLHGENQRLKERVAELEAEVMSLNGRVTKLEGTEIDPELRKVLREIQAGDAA